MSPKPKPRPRGRPRLPKGRSRAETLQVRMAPGELQALQAAAKAADMAPSSLARSAILRALGGYG